jgi:hypothetical protein
MKGNRNIELLFSVLVFCDFSTSAHAFSDKTHKALTENVILSSDCEIANTS